MISRPTAIKGAAVATSGQAYSLPTSDFINNSRGKKSLFQQENTLSFYDEEYCNFTLTLLFCYSTR